MGSTTYMYTYLGLFDKVAEWVFGGISKAISWLFESVFGPIFKSVLEPIAPEIIKLVKAAFSAFLFLIYQGLLRIIDVIQTSFMIFGGATKVEYEGQSKTLVEVLFTSSAVGSAFAGITMIAVILLGVFTLVAVAKKAADVGMTEQRSFGNILTDMIKAIIGFLAIPALCLAAVLLSAAVLSAAYDATSDKTAANGEGKSATIASTLFNVTTATAIEQARDNDKGKNDAKWGADEYGRFKAQKEPWKHVVSDMKFNSSIKESDCIDHYIELYQIDYLVGYFSALFLIWNLLAVSFQFVQRLFEIVLMYLICPLFTAYMPLDGGEKLKKWQSMFLGKLGGGIGLLIMVNLFLMMVPMVVGGNINLTGGEVGSENTIYNLLIELIFVLGAALAVKNSGSLMTTLIDAEAGAAESQSVSSGMSMIGDAASWGFDKVKDYESKRKDRQEKRQKFSNGKEFGKKQNAYKADMKRADGLEKSGHKQEADKLRDAASKQWQIEKNKASQAGLISLDDSKAGYHATDATFGAGVQEGRGKNTLMGRAKRMARNRAKNKELASMEKKNSRDIAAGRNAYNDHVESKPKEILSQIGDAIKKRLDPSAISRGAAKGRADAHSMQDGAPSFGGGAAGGPKPGGGSGAAGGPKPGGGAAGAAGGPKPGGGAAGAVGGPKPGGGAGGAAGGSTEVGKKPGDGSGGTSGGSSGSGGSGGGSSGTSGSGGSSGGGADSGSGGNTEQPITYGGGEGGSETANITSLNRDYGGGGAGAADGDLGGSDESTADFGLEEEPISYGSEDSEEDETEDITSLESDGTVAGAGGSSTGGTRRRRKLPGLKTHLSQLADGDAAALGAARLAGSRPDRADGSGTGAGGSGSGGAGAGRSGAGAGRSSVSAESSGRIVPTGGHGASTGGGTRSRRDTRSFAAKAADPTSSVLTDLSSQIEAKETLYQEYPEIYDAEAQADLSSDYRLLKTGQEIRSQALAQSQAAATATASEAPGWGSGLSEEIRDSIGKPSLDPQYDEHRTVAQSGSPDPSGKYRLKPSIQKYIRSSGGGQDIRAPKPRLRIKKQKPGGGDEKR